MLEHTICTLVTIGITLGILAFGDQITQPISRYLPGHQHKANTPTLGGIAIILGFCTPLALGLDKFLWIFGVALVSFAVGLADDLIKITTQDNAGMSKLLKFICMTPGIALCVYFGFGYECPFLFISRILFILGGAAAMDVTDGLDGLAALISICILLTISLRFPAVYNVAMPLYAATFGFLLFNLKPAKIFMGDCGSLMIGSVIASLFIQCNFDITFITISTVPILNGISVIARLFMIKIGLQHYKFRAPLHHQIEEYLGETGTTSLLVLITAILCALNI